MEGGCSSSHHQAVTHSAAGGMVRNAQAYLTGICLPMGMAYILHAAYAQISHGIHRHAATTHITHCFLSLLYNILFSFTRLTSYMRFVLCTYLVTRIYRQDTTNLSGTGTPSSWKPTRPRCRLFVSSLARKMASCAE